MMEITELQRIGVGLVGFGVFFLLFGVLLYMDSVLLAFGNILFLSGLAVIIGLRRTFGFFFQRERLKGTSFFLGGIVIVLLKWPVLGMLLETYGFINLFSSTNQAFFPQPESLPVLQPQLRGKCLEKRAVGRTFFPIAFGFLGALVNIPFLSKVLQVFEAPQNPANPVYQRDKGLGRPCKDHLSPGLHMQQTGGVEYCDERAECTSPPAL